MGRSRGHGTVEPRGIVATQQSFVGNGRDGLRRSGISVTRSRGDVLTRDKVYVPAGSASVLRRDTARQVVELVSSHRAAAGRRRAREQSSHIVEELAARIE